MTDRENENLVGDIDGLIGYISFEGKEYIDIRYKKEVVPVPKRERHHVIYKLLEDNCDVIFCTDQKNDDFMFECREQFVIFAVDGGGNCFGTIGGMGDINDDNYPVGYVCHEGLSGRIANNFREFMELVNFYPFWYDILKFEKMGINYSISELENERIEFNSKYLEQQEEIAKILNLNKNNDSIKLLISNLKDKPKFTVYGLDEEHNPYQNLL